MATQKGILDFVKRAAPKRTFAENAESVFESDLKKPKVKHVGEENVKPLIKESVDLKNDLSEEENTKLFNNYIGSKDTLAGENIAIPLKDKKIVWPNEIIAKIELTSKRSPAVHTNIGHSWFRVLEPEFKKPYFLQLSQFLQQERAKRLVFPPEDQVWTWTQLCSVTDVKVVILGQDPYHNPGQAHGLCFSVPIGVHPPPSLLNMYQELEEDIPGFKRPSHGNLSGWAEQGVLLLNACLTVRSYTANSHKDKGWEQFTDAVIKYLSSTRKDIVFLLWGAYAQKKATVVDMKRHYLLKSTHPSPLSAHRGFLGCKHFSQCNKLLKQAGKTPIDWAYLPPAH